MIVTPAEAKQMMCCSTPAQDKPKTFGQCVSTACMAWRWALEAVEDDGTIRPVESKTYGYCGMAGDAS